MDYSAVLYVGEIQLCFLILTNFTQYHNPESKDWTNVFSETVDSHILWCITTHYIIQCNSNDMKVLCNEINSTFPHVIIQFSISRN